MIGCEFCGNERRRCDVQGVCLGRADKIVSTALDERAPSAVRSLALSDFTRLEARFEAETWADLFSEALRKRSDRVRAKSRLAGMNNSELARALTADIVDASFTALRGAECIEDGGTCCLDRVHISVGGSSPIKRWGRLFDAAIKDLGSYLDHAHAISLCASGDGQAARRTAFCEALAHELSSRGWPAHVYYVTD